MIGEDKADRAESPKSSGSVKGAAAEANAQATESQSPTTATEAAAGLCETPDASGPADPPEPPEPPAPPERTNSAEPPTPAKPPEAPKPPKPPPEPPKAPAPRKLEDTPSRGRIYFVSGLGTGLVIALLAVLRWPERIGESPYMPVIFAFLIATIAANIIPAPPRDDLRLAIPESLSPHAVWLLCFLLVVGTIMVPRLVDRYAEVERVRMCARVAAIGLKQANGGDPKGHRVHCRAGR